MSLHLASRRVSHGAHMPRAKAERTVASRHCFMCQSHVFGVHEVTGLYHLHTGSSAHNSLFLSVQNLIHLTPWAPSTLAPSTQESEHRYVNLGQSCFQGREAEGLWWPAGIEFGITRFDLECTFCTSLLHVELTSYYIQILVWGI